MTSVRRHLLSHLGCAAFGGVLFIVGQLAVHEPLGLAFWSVVVAIILLPLAYDERKLHTSRYVAATIALLIGLSIFVGLKPAIVFAAVAWSLIGGVQFLVAIRLPASVAIAATMLGAGLSFTWPIWMAGILATHDLGDGLQRMIDVSPAFALNATITPADPLTHRPLAYKLMNLGQDVDYAMPTSVWQCVVLHAGVGVIGTLATIIATHIRRAAAHASTPK